MKRVSGYAMLWIPIASLFAYVSYFIGNMAHSDGTIPAPFGFSLLPVSVVIAFLWVHIATKLTKNK